MKQKRESFFQNEIQNFLEAASNYETHQKHDFLYKNKKNILANYYVSNMGC